MAQGAILFGCSMEKRQNGVNEHAPPKELALVLLSAQAEIKVGSSPSSGSDLSLDRSEKGG